MKDVGTQCEEDQLALDIQESVHLVAISHGQGAIEAMMRNDEWKDIITKC